MLWVGVLGELELGLDGVPVDPPASRRARSLLGLLALEPQQHPRSRLAAQFWPDVLDESARTSLRAALAAIRRSLGRDADEYLIATRERVGLSDGVKVDAAEFEQLVTAGRLEAAIALWRGDLLTGLDDDWVLVARDEWREKACRVFARLAEAAETSGDVATALGYARRMVALEPLAEEGQRTLIRLLAARGDRAAALATYSRYAERLRAELQVIPSPETRRLVVELREDDGTQRLVSGEPLPAAPLPAGTLPAEPLPSEPVLAEPRPADSSQIKSAITTLLFTDIVGSTELLDHLGDEPADRLRRAHFGLLRDVALSHGGHEVKSLGDGLMVAFDSSVDAAACAIGIQRAIAHRNEREPASPIKIRIGLHLGEAIRDEGDYYGAAVIVAKRLCDQAAGGQILTSQLVVSLIGDRGDFVFRPVGELALKGFSQPVAACELGWEKVAAQSIALPAELVSSTGVLLGRQTEQRTLNKAWDQVREHGAHVVLVGGEPGIGKTRLVGEICRRVHVEGAVVLLGRSPEETLAPYQPFVDALRHYVSHCPSEELLVQVGNRRSVLARLIPELGAGDGAAGLGAEMRGEGEGERYVLFDAVTSFVREIARAHPTILMLDDLHWADPHSLLMLRHVARSAGDIPLLILGTYRDLEVQENDALAVGLAELRRFRLLTSLRLGGLGDEDVGVLIQQRGSTLDDDLVRTVAERTEGNPFFVEEVMRYLDAGFEWTVPESVKDLLLRRLRGLDAQTREAIAAAAVLGSEFELAALERMTGTDPDELLDAMDRALEASVLVESVELVGRYAFAHGLIRETIYARLSAARRARLHARAGDALAAIHAERLDDYAAQLANHFLLAGDDARSFPYQLRAARIAATIYAAETAIRHYSAALDAGDRLGLSLQNDERMRQAFFERAWARHSAGDLEAALADYGRVLDAARVAGDRRLEAQALNGMGYAEKLFDIDRAQEHHRAALVIANELGDPQLQVMSINRLSLAMSNQLDLAGALESGERALEIARAAGGEHGRAIAIDALKLAALQLGDLDRLEQLTAELAELDRRRGDLWYLQWTLLEASFVPIGRARWDVGRGRLEEALAISHRVSNPLADPLIHDALGWLERSRGNYGEALAAGRRAVELAASGASGPWNAWTRATLGWSLLELNAVEDAIAVLEPGVEEAEMLADYFRTAAHLAWARTLVGDSAGADQACALAEQALWRLRLPAGGAFVFGFGAGIDLARADLAAGRTERSEAALRPLLDAAERSRWYEAAASASFALGLCHQSRDADGEARTDFARAIELAERHHLPGVEWRARDALAGLLAGEQALRLRSASAAIVEELAASVGDDRLAATLTQAARDQS
jgi:class 3 adenylate cyclase/DNA-binding SARP family transcriptional activator/tetratricopeptide (TPR) repeat protein